MAVLRATTRAQTSQVAVSRQRSVSRNVTVAAFRNAQRPSTAEPQAESDVLGRRQALFAGLIVTASLATAAPSEAFLGIGEGSIMDQYQNDTGSILKEVRGVLDLQKGDATAETKVKDLRTDINKWVAKYRREPTFSGKQSYGNTYTVLNALAGHFNSFGPTAPIPKKRLDRIVKEVSDAEKMLARNR